MSDDFFMQLAIDKAYAYQFLTYPNPAVGCVVVDEHGALLSIQAHQKAGQAHAEVLALKEAYIKLTDDKAIDTIEDSHALHEYLIAHHNGIFALCTMYVTLEPCAHHGRTPSCANLIGLLKIKKLFISVKDSTPKAQGGAAMLEKSGCEVVYGTLQKEGEELLAPFLKYHSGKSVVLFKWAQHLNGTNNRGVISSKTSRTHVHALRTVVNRLFIGGNTVRTDRPTLDSRLVKGKAPDMTIVSRQKVDTTIPLFSVPHREVTIEKNFDSLSDYGLVLIEGTHTLFELIKDKVDYFLIYQSASIKKGQAIQGDFDGRFVHTQRMGEDCYFIIKRSDA